MNTASSASTTRGGRRAGPLGALLLVPLAGGPIWAAIVMLAAFQLIVDLFVQVYMATS